MMKEKKVNNKCSFRRQLQLMTLNDYSYTVSEKESYMFAIAGEPAV
jgi:hypothetical protein